MTHLKTLSLFSALLFSSQINAGAVDSVLADFAQCKLFAPLLVTKEITSKPLYQLNNGLCEALPPSKNGSFFADTQCQKPISYRFQSTSDFCLDAFDSDSFGNGATTEEDVWWQHPALSMDIGLEKLKGNSVPFETRTVYKTVKTDRGSGSCQLEMRVYKQDIDKTGLKPLLMFHGGSWNARGGMIGLQTQLSHYTDDGFVVFTPFYRLTGENDANVECNGVTGEAIVEDANDALDWVRENAQQYGGIVSDKGLLVAGQSAGGHLAASLAVHRPDQIARALVFYPPTDFPAVLSEWQTNGIPTNSQGVAAVAGFLGEAVLTANVDSDLVQSNAFPKIVSGKQGEIPPLFMIHGDADALVPVTQSARLCNALATGDPDNGPASDLSIPGGAAKKVIQCTVSASQFHVIAGADHILDICIEPFVCPAGTVASKDAARNSIIAARQWLTQGASVVSTPPDSGERDNPVINNPVADPQEEKKSGGGAINFLILLLLFGRRILTPER